MDWKRVTISKQTYNRDGSWSMLRSHAHEYSYLSSGCRLNGLIGRHRFPTCCREALVVTTEAARRLPAGILLYKSMPLVFLVVAYSKNRWTYLIDQYVKRCVFSQGCAFWGWENLNLIFNWFIWKNWKNYNGAYGENFKKFKTVITPVVNKIESLFLVLGYGFRGWAI